MFIIGLGTAAPPQRYSQQECWEVFQHSTLSKQLNPRGRAIVKKVLTGNNGIVTRHFALENLQEAFELSSDVLHARFRKQAPLLAVQAARRALADAGCEPGQIDALIISTTKFGFFVELESMFIEGLVPIDTLPGDRYVYHENTRTIIGIFRVQRSKARKSLCSGTMSMQ